MAEQPRYMTSLANLHAILARIQEGVAPPKFTTAHLASIGFGSSNDRGVVGLLKSLGFLSASGEPLQRYHDYRDKTKAAQVLAEALREAYPPAFAVSEWPDQTHRDQLAHAFASRYNLNERIAGLMATTFLRLAELADFGSVGVSAGTGGDSGDRAREDLSAEPPRGALASTPPPSRTLELRHDIHVHLPATKDMETYVAIFRAIKEVLLAP